MIWSQVECPCGHVAAIPENGYFPVCGECGCRMVAPLPPVRAMFNGPDPAPLGAEVIEAELRKRGFPVGAEA